MHLVDLCQGHIRTLNNSTDEVTDKAKQSRGQSIQRRVGGQKLR